MNEILSRIYNSLQKRFFKTEFDRTYDRWIMARGDETLRLNYPLNQHSLVLDLGGYRGDWTDQVYKQYGCNVMVFEPVPHFAENIRSRFKAMPKVQIFTHGISNSDKTVTFVLDENSSTQFAKKSGNPTEIKLLGVVKFFADHGLQHIDLMKLNIEAGEFDLLECMLDHELVGRVDNFQIQFHDFFPEAKARREKIIERLNKTHEITYSYPFIWENWKRR
jgi:FkbM family methyltransferase